MRARKIPVSAPDLSGNEEVYVAHAVRSGWISGTGEYVTRFESEFAAFCGTGAAVAVSSGTAALHLSLAALGVAPGDEVLVPSLTFAATANAVRYLGAEPVFVDVDIATWCLDPTVLEQFVTSRTVGIIAVHLYGHPADMHAINRVAGRHGLWVVEDAAEAHCSTYWGKPVGGLGTASAFSFYGNKVITCGEGGAVAVSGAGLADRMRSLRNHGAVPGPHYVVEEVGFSFRLSNVACAILCAQLERLESILVRRRRIWSQYRSLLADLPGIGFQPVAPWAVLSPWLFNITVDAEIFGRNRDELALELSRSGMETRPFFAALHTLRPYHAAAAARGGEFPVSIRLSEQGLSLPVFPALPDTDVEAIANALRSAAR